MWSRLLRQFPRCTTPRLVDLTITLYSREGCCLCDQALDLLRDRQGRDGFALEEVDIDTDPALVGQFGEFVPVVALGGKVRFRGIVNPALLDRLLEAEGRSRSGAASDEGR